MSRQFWTDFLELYMSFPCLWKVDAESYRNRDCRSAAMKELLKKLQEVEPLANIKTVSKKVNGFRTTFRQAYKKYKMSSKSGTSADDVEEPSLWYYYILLPTALSQGTVRESKSTLDDSFFDDLRDEKEPARNSSSVYLTSPQSTDDASTLFELPDMDGIDSNTAEIDLTESAAEQKHNSSTRTARPTMNQKRSVEKNSLTSKPKKQKKLKDLLEVACEVLARPEQPVLPNRFSHVGSNVAGVLEELNKNDPTQCLLAEKLINDVLFQARLGQLTFDSCVAEVTQNN